jgi:hypothetical protein
MNHDEIREHIQSAAVRQSAERRRLTARMLRRCWPGGAEDRTEPAARNWIRRWRPAKGAAILPACSCASGRCVLCN